MGRERAKAVVLHPTYSADDDDDDSYQAFAPGREQAPSNNRPAPLHGFDDSAHLAEFDGERGTAGKVSFSLDNVGDAAAVDSPDSGTEYANSYQRSAYANSYSRDKNEAVKKKGGSPTNEDDGGKKKKGRYAAPADNRKHKVRPYRCYSEPTYMTEDELYDDMMKPSENVAFLKSHFPPSTSKIPGEMKISEGVRKMYDSPEVDGRIGSVRVEVLGCVGLARQKPYCAVYVVSGDCAFCTDVLNNFRSPMWPSVSMRAAVFPVHHAYARVFVGLFDVRTRQGKENDVFCGRVVIDVAQLRPNTEYDITFPMRASSFIYDRRKRGVIRLRFSLHWFSERMAICSYLKSSRWFSQSEPTKGLGQPTIPCAEPKTFRNVAVTCHGQDFPGKYTRVAFRATMREFNLYHINLRFVLKTFMLDALLYERPHISLYLFVTFQHCIYSNAVRHVLPYFSGYMILLFLDNYMHFNVSERFNLGYKPLSVREVFMGLIKDGKSNDPNFEPLEVKKRAKKKAQRNKQKQEQKEQGFFASWGLGSPDDLDPADDGVEVEPRDHREFPFSERDEYPKFSVQEALAPSTKAPVKGEEGNTRMAGRLSIYFVKEEEKEVVEEEEEGEEGEEEEEDSEDEEEDENEEENIETAADTQVGDVDVFDMDFEPEEDEVKHTSSGGAGLFDVGSSKLKRARVRVGPPQNCDISSKKKTPPQQTLQKIEKQMHKLSRGIALERVITVPGARKYGPELGEEEGKSKKGKKGKVDDSGKKAHYDEFDKILGLQSKTANPVLRITSSFLGPLMRMIRIFLYVVRVCFNMATWRDPYFSFWILCFLVTQTIVLLIFPWRPFLFLSSFLCLGPQNVFVRKYLEKKAAEKAIEKAQAAREEAVGDISGYAPTVNDARVEPIEYVTSGGKDDFNMERFGNGTKKFDGKTKKGLMSKMKARKDKDDDMAIYFDAQVDNVEDRPAFSTQHSSSRKKGLRPREVAVPYSKLRKDRFFDWPPDPTVSRATPLPGPWLEKKAADANGSSNAQAAEKGSGSPAAQPVPGAKTGLSEELEKLRRRYVAEQQQFAVDGAPQQQIPEGISPW